MMRVKGITFFLVFLAFPAFLQSQSTLTFARVVESAEFATTGFAVVNPSSANSTVTFTLYGVGGEILTSAIRTIPPRGQLASVASDLFASITIPGWVEVTSETTGLQGLWVAGNFVNFADGTDAAVSASELVLPFVAPQSELNVVNSSSKSLSVLIRVYGEDGLELASPDLQLVPPKGFFRARLSDLFPGTETAARHIRLKCTNPFAASLISTDFPVASSRAIVNAISPATAPADFTFPHVVNGRISGTNYSSIVGITNLASSEQSVTITFTPDDGSGTLSVDRILPGNGAIRTDLTNLFGLPNAVYRGWLRSTATLPITGFVLFAEATGRSVAVVSPQPARTELLFAHIADLQPWHTGIALLNSSFVQSASVEVFAITRNGNLIGGARNVSTARFSIPAGQNIVKLLMEWIPQTQSRPADGGSIYIRSNVPLYGLGLFLTRDLRISSNAPHGLVSPDVNYTPPDP